MLTEKSALGTIKYTYEDGMLAKITDYNGNEHSFSYDANGNVISYTDGAGATTTLSYDKDGNLSSVENALGNKTELKYNPIFDSL